MISKFSKRVYSHRTRTEELYLNLAEVDVEKQIWKISWNCKSSWLCRDVSTQNSSFNKRSKFLFKSVRDDYSNIHLHGSIGTYFFCIAFRNRPCILQAMHCISCRVQRQFWWISWVLENVFLVDRWGGLNNSKWFKDMYILASIHMSSQAAPMGKARSPLTDLIDICNEN